MDFSLHSPYTLAGDQPQAVDALVRGLENQNRYQTLLGVTGSGKTFTMANIVSRVQKPTLVIVHNKTLAAQLASEFRIFFPKNAVQYFVSYYDYYQPEAYLPQTDTYIAKDAMINEEIDKLRHQATMSLLTRKDVLIVASVSCIYGLGDPSLYAEGKVSIEAGATKKRQQMLRDLIAIQYHRNDISLARGDFRVRGDIVEVHPPYADDLIRIDFDGDTITTITRLDPLTGEVYEKLPSVAFYPAKHYTATPESITSVVDRIRADLDSESKALLKRGKILEAERLKQRVSYDIEMLLESGTVSGIENYSRYFEGRPIGSPPSTLIDYFPKDFLLFVDESHMTIPQIGGMYEGDRSRKLTLIEHGFRLKAALDNRPLKFEEFESKIAQGIFVSATPGPFEKQLSSHIVEQLVRPTGILDPTIDVRPSEHQVDDLLDEIRIRTARQERVLVTTLTKRSAEDLTDYLKEADVKVHYLHSDVDTLERLETLRDLRLGIYDVVVGINLLREGLDLPEVSLVAILDADKEGFLRNATSLIQTIGRAARHLQGQVLLYADRITDSMKIAIDETRRRRTMQEEWNAVHQITPTAIEKEIRDDRLSGKREASSVDVTQVTVHGEALAEIIRELEAKMDLLSRNLEFEEAARVRDEIKTLREIQREGSNTRGSQRQSGRFRPR